MKQFWYNLIAGLCLILIPWMLILAQMSGLAWLTFANSTTARYFVVSMMVLSAVGTGFMVNGASKRIIWIIVALLAQLGVFLMMGYLGLLDAQANIADFAYSENGFYYSLDAMGGFTGAVMGLSGIVSIVAKAIPLAVLVWGIIGIMLSDSPDEATTPLIETGIVIGVLAVFYLIGNWIGFV